MNERKRSQSSILKSLIIAVLFLIIIGAGVYFGGLFGPLQNLFSGLPDKGKVPLSPFPSLTPSAAPSAAPAAQAPAQSLEKMVEEALQNIKKGSASKPSVSPDKKKIAYIAPFDWEVIGDVHIYEVEKKKDNVVLNSGSIKFQHTPKDVEWMDDRYLLVVVGFGYGTVSVGGDMYVLDTRENKFTLAVTAGERKEFKDIYMDKGVIILETAVFNKDLTNYTIEKKKLTPDEILASIKK